MLQLLFASRWPSAWPGNLTPSASRVGPSPSASPVASPPPVARSRPGTRQPAPTPRAPPRADAPPREWGPARNGPAVAGRNAIARGRPPVRESTRAGTPTSARPSPGGWSGAWGVVSLSADMVYEGARSVYGPALARAWCIVLRLWAWSPGRVGGRARPAPGLRPARRPDGVTGHDDRRLGPDHHGRALLPSRRDLAPPIPSRRPSCSSCSNAPARPSAARAKSAPSPTPPGPRSRPGFGVHKALDQTGAFAGPCWSPPSSPVPGRCGRVSPLLAVPGALA